ncbi:peroxisomal acyl-coenzyme A oxidase 1-like [Babylonia areolata]|uniref:peroxisomal acyl-coenzyme A oxidase 1-like n=1 Tax=Babylonia areolata TaxID=304850 RepID=UPI003FD2B885
MAAGVNPDLAKERCNATFDPEELTNFMYGGAETTKRKRYLQNVAIEDAKKQGFKRPAHLSREEQYELELQKSAYAFSKEKQLGLVDPLERHLFREAVMPREPGPYNLHNSMFTDSIERLASDEQKAKWLPLAKSFRLVGTYAQTELGHGSFLRGLETTATYDPRTQEFIINSPTITSTKYWPGGLGKTSNCCVVMAQLISNGRTLGMHSFLVQIRDLDTHQPLPGVTVGDIGNKFGYQGIDNGFLRFDNVHIPRENMMMKHSKVLPDGTYLKPKSDRLIYGGMTFIRVAIVGDVGRGLAKAATIAVRYSCVRRQSEIQPGAGEVQVMDFQTQQYRLLPQVANAYALFFAGRSMMLQYMATTAEINQGAFGGLAQLHALSAGLKAVSSWSASEGVEVCRLACGGHGYSLASGLPKIYVDVTPSCTYEGENYVMILQTARYLLKCMTAVQQGEQLPDIVKFLQSPPGGRSGLDQRLELSDLISAYEHRTARLVQEAAQKVQAAIARGSKSYQAWNDNSVDLAAAGKAFAEGHIVKAFAESVSPLTGPLKSVMLALCRLYAAKGIMDSLGDFMKDGYLSGQQASMLQTSVLDLLKELRPNAVALVDAFDFPDAVLDSALGRWDGQVYQALYDYSLHSKLNEKQVLDAYHKYQRPFMESQWSQGKAPLTSRL